MNGLGLGIKEEEVVVYCGEGYGLGTEKFGNVRICVFFEKLLIVVVRLFLLGVLVIFESVRLNEFRSCCFGI